MRFLAATIAFLILVSAGLIAEQKHAGKKPKDAKQAVARPGNGT